METDIAVIEELIDNIDEWHILAYLGPDRSDGLLKFFYPENQTVRIRYINKWVRRTKEELMNLKAPWNQPSDRNEMPGDYCCQRATGKYCYDHDHRNYK